MTSSTGLDSGDKRIMKARSSLLAIILVVLAASAWYFVAGSRPAPATTAPTDNDYSIVVDLSDRQLYVLNQGTVVHTYPVAVGMKSHPTPRGRFAIEHVVWNPYWHPPDAAWADGKSVQEPGPDNPMGRVKMFFQEPDYFIHGTPEEDSVGRPDSHGCVRMYQDDAISLARQVMAHGGEVRPASWFDRVLDHFRDTREVYLSDPVPVTIRE